MRQPLVVGNWKMHGSRAETARLAGRIHALVANLGVEVVVAPPFPFLADVATVLANHEVKVAAQDVAVAASGPFTGEVSAEMVADVGCDYVIVGHSERRAQFGESDKLVADKVLAALRAGLVPIVCVGETQAQREAGETEAVVGRQLEAVLSELAGLEDCGLVVAYEPVWAIGTGLTATPEQVAQVHGFIRRLLVRQSVDSRILYGGSVKPENADALFAQVDVDGGLIGGASLNEETFAAICRAAD
jgi:triosephosphate isomerase (TIM)